MLTESEAIAVASQEFQQRRPQDVVEVVNVFTRDNGLTWTIHFRRPPPRVTVDEETGIVTETICSNSVWILCVSGETGRVGWAEML